MNYLETTEELGKKFYLEYKDKGKVLMLNLLKYREEADYSNVAELAPRESLTGKEAYALYMKETMPFLDEHGSKLIFLGNCSFFLIGPESEKWDAVLLVEHESVEKFVSFAQNKSYLAIAGHRKAALLDSRLLPIQQT